MLILTLVLSPIKLNAHISRQGVGNNDEISLKVKALFGLVRYRFRVPMMKLGGLFVTVREESESDLPWKHAFEQNKDDIDKGSIDSALQNWGTLLQLFRHLELWLRRALKRVDIVEWRWHTTVGAGDAMWTAMTTGAVWSVKTSLLGFLSQLVRLKTEPEMSVQPDYQQASFRTDWLCTAKLSLWDAVAIGLQLAARLKKSKTSIKKLQSMLNPQPSP
ncbi:DUF2953 domain-containing protein [Paenibacillus thailandensis]|uniref:DUF2953 domain-containing protein n=1 Tax=Paenibacillus thailandensis TaxID=393250 RepID=A0ABW5R0B3_9BACL